MSGFHAAGIDWRDIGGSFYNSLGHDALGASCPAPARCRAAITGGSGRSLCVEVGLMGMPSERVKFFNTDRGYGFIAPDDGGPHVFVHVHDVEAAGMKKLVADQLVAYEVGLARDGRSKAVNLRLLNP